MHLTTFSHPHIYECNNIKFDELNTDYQIEHTHNHYELLFVTSGSYLNKINDKSFILNKNDCSFLTLQDHHSIYGRTNTFSQTTILIEKEYFEQKCKLFSDTFLELIYNSDLTKFTLTVDQSNRLISYLNILKTKIISNEQINIFSTLILNIIFEAICSQIEKGNDNVFPPHFHKMINALGEYKNSYWKAKDLADFAGYTETHVNRLFQKYLGVSTNRYINKVKISKAKYMLSTSNRPITEISLILGFNSVSHFINTFKKECGITPHQYRLGCK